MKKNSKIKHSILLLSQLIILYVHTSLINTSSLLNNRIITRYAQIFILYIYFKTKRVLTRKKSKLY